MLLLLLLSGFSRVQLCATPWRQPIRLPRPWDSPGKNTGVGCHFLLQRMKVIVKVKLLCHVRLLATPWNAAHQAPPSMGFSTQAYWSGVPLPSLIQCHYLIIKWSIHQDNATILNSSVQLSSVTQSCPTLCDPMNHRTPGLPVHHQLPEFTQTHIHRVSDAIQPSHPLASHPPPTSNPSEHQSLFQWVNSSHEVAKVLEFQL